MLKKKHKSAHDVSYLKNKRMQCSVCNSFASKSMSYVCNSGHVICENCHEEDISESRKDNGDFVSEMLRSKHIRKFKKNSIINVYPNIKDLASGDCEKQNIKCKTKSESRLKNIGQNRNDYKTASDNLNGNDEIKTTLEYKNTNFKANSNSSLISTTSEQDVDDVPQFSENYICPRPVTCPVNKCNRMIALDSVMLHFYFDHSKIQRVTLNSGSTSHITFKPNDLSPETQCLAVLFVINANEKASAKIDSSSILNRTHADCKSLLLMAAIIPIEGSKSSDEHAAYNLISIEKEMQQIYKSNQEKKIEDVVKLNKCEKIPNRIFGKSEILVVWLCKLEDCLNCYSVFLHNENVKQGHKYLGEAIHIRHDQKALSIYEKAECLIVHGVAVNRLLHENNDLYLSIDILE